MVQQQISLIAATGLQTAQLIGYSLFGGGQVGTFSVTPNVSALFVQANYDTNQVISPTNQGQKFYLQKAFHKYNLVNCSPVECYVTIYDCISKVTKGTKSDPQSDWAAGLAATAHGGTASSNARIGAKPVISKNFNINWKIVGRNTYTLNGGQRLEHKFLFTPRRLVDMEYFNGFEQIRGITHCTFAVAYGSIYDDLHSDAVNAVTTTTGIGYTQAKLVGIWESAYTCRVGTQGSRFTVYDTNLNSTGTNKYVQGEDDGGVSNLATVTEFS